MNRLTDGIPEVFTVVVLDRRGVLFQALDVLAVDAVDHRLCPHGPSAPRVATA